MYSLYLSRWWPLPGWTSRQEPSLKTVHEALLRRQLAILAQRGQRAAALVAGQRRRPHGRTATPAGPSTISKSRMIGPRLPATAAVRGRAIAKQERWQQWRLVCVQAVLQRVRDAERRKQDRRAQAWADGQGAPAAQGDTGDDDRSSTADAADASSTGPHGPNTDTAATHDTQTNTVGNNINNTRPKRRINTVVSYDETDRRTRRRTPQEREAYIRDRKRKNVALIPTGARIVHMRTDV